MKKIILLTICTILVLMITQNAVLADETMNRIDETGKIRVGWSKDSPPFCYLDSKTGEYAGFSVDMTHILADKLSERFGEKIEIQPFAVTSETSAPNLADRTIDIEMSCFISTQKRNEDVDFSLVFLFSETTFLVEKDSNIKLIEDLNGKMIGAACESDKVAVINSKVKNGVFRPKGDVLEYKTPASGFLDLKQGNIDALCADRIVLEGLRAKASRPDMWETVDFAIIYEPYAYMIREDNSDFRDFVNNTIVWTINTGRFFEMYNKWMGPKPLKTLEKRSHKIAGKVRNISIATMVGITLFIGLIVFFYSRKLTGNIRYLSDVADRISIGELNAEIDVKSKDEIGVLAEAIGRMQDSVKLSIERLRRR